MAITQPGPLHRLGLAVEDADAAAAWFEDVLGATPVATMRSASDAEGDPDGGYMKMLWLAGQPFLVMGASTPDGFVAGFLRRYGPAVHSLAWEIEDLWRVEHLLRQRDVRITGVSVEGRHFFMHPQDTQGLLMEWTDGAIGRFATKEPGIGTTGVLVRELAWVTGVVADIDAAAAMFEDFGGACRMIGRPTGPSTLERTADLMMGPVPVRLVTPRSPASRYSLDRGPGWSSVGLRVDDLDVTLAQLERAGVKVEARDGRIAWTDPDTTCGLALEWTD
jgi:catechol 2,3-dioxygenase-like lactoylglutathione lyase family enzyme